MSREWILEFGIIGFIVLLCIIIVAYFMRQGNKRRKERSMRGKS